MNPTRRRGRGSGGRPHLRTASPAWSYPEPYPDSFEKVGQDYSGYVAFDKEQVTIA